MEPLASIQTRPVCVVKSHILHDVTLFSQNRTDIDRKVDKHSWWRAAVSTSTKLRRKGRDPGTPYIWSIAGVNLYDSDGCNTEQNGEGDLDAIEKGIPRIQGK